MMKRLCKTILALGLTPPATFAGAEMFDPAGPAETLVFPDGAKLKGRLKVEPGHAPFFQGEFAQTPTPIEPGMTLQFDPEPLPTVAGIPPFRVELGRGQQISGRLGSLSDERLTIADPITDAKIPIARGGVHALVQRPGEVQVFQDGFETLDKGRWTVVGLPTIVDDLKSAGEHSLRLGPEGTSLTHRLDTPFSSGRLELAFHDGLQVVAGREWWVDLTFKNIMGTQTLRVLLGWNESLLGVENVGGASLRVQRLLRKEGWHRLAVRFSPDRSEVSVDRNELTVGKDLKGPLVEIKIASYPTLKADDAPGLAGHIDDLRLIKHDEPVVGLEVDGSQDEIRLTQGDQIFGSALVADSDQAKLQFDGRPLAINWSEISGLHLKRLPSQGAEIEGMLVKVDWQAGLGDDVRDHNVMEGAIRSLDDKTLVLQTAYAGLLEIARGRLHSITLIGNKPTHRIEIDSTSHHLGNDIVTMDPMIDPPHPEGPVLERSFELAKWPEGNKPIALVVDAVQVLGEANDLPYSAQIKKGELRTNLKINGVPFDYLNRVVTSRNVGVERFRYVIPREHLRLGKNTIRFEQVGNANDPNYLDDLGLLGIAIEYD